MKRDIYAQLESWKTSERRKPLILNGARQVGKTYAVKHFGKTSYKKTIYLNFEKDERLETFFHDSLDPKEILKILSIYSETDIEPQNTLIFFDEIQECPKALNSLKYFQEEANEYHIIAAGSLLGVKLAREKGFPVGKVNFMQLRPLSFFEFLSATNHEKLRTFIEDYSSFDPLPIYLHEKLISLLKLYLFIGGMPEAVAEYVKNEKLPIVREIQLEILEAYEKDFAKHAPVQEVMNIQVIWKQVYRQLAKENKKFIFAAIRKSARGRDYEVAIQWLIDAGLIYKSCFVNTPKLPLGAYADTSSFKLFLCDIGLLGAQSNLSVQVLINENTLFTEFKGALTENYAAQELMARRNKELYYWTSEGVAELDFLLESELEIYPLEVKAGVSSKKKSLVLYGDKYCPSKLLRSTLMNLKHDGKIYNYPLYMIGLLNNL